MQTEEMYLKTVISPLISFPDEIVIDKIIDDKGVLLSLTLHKEDMGKIIGKQGEMARALRRVLRQFGTLKEQSIALKILEPKE